MPKAIFFRFVIFIKLFRLISYFIKSMQKKSTATASGVKHKVVVFYVHHFDGETHNFAGSKVLPAYALEKSLHKLLKGNALYIKISFIERNTLQVSDDGIKFFGFNFQTFLK